MAETPPQPYAHEWYDAVITRSGVPMEQAVFERLLRERGADVAAVMQTYRAQARLVRLRRRADPLFVHR
ncbi:MAG TPA: hypothetical protein VKD22_03795 [Ramlibacter sp.]|jgi:hypothetical protein|nr:hypothetical protein [Ramlibacter sp.]